MASTYTKKAKMEWAMFWLFGVQSTLGLNKAKNFENYLNHKMEENLSICLFKVGIWKIFLPFLSCLAHCVAQWPKAKVVYDFALPWDFTFLFEVLIIVDLD